MVRKAKSKKVTKKIIVTAKPKKTSKKVSKKGGMSPSQLYHAFKINRAEYEALIGKGKGKKPVKSAKKKSVKRILGKKAK